MARPPSFFKGERATEDVMGERIVRLRLNQQQLELIDKTVKAGEAPSRAELIRRALKEFAAAHAAPTKV